MKSQVSDQLEAAVSDHDAIDAAALHLQKLVSGALERVPAPVLRVLHGDVVGHPVHPLLVHLPLGGWLIAVILDVLPLVGKEEQERAADLALLLGTVGATGTIATGWADWSKVRGQARRTGLIHGALNETAFLLNGASLWCRWKGRRGLGKALSAGGLALAVAGGFLGGQLVYHHGLGVHRTLSTPQG